MRSSPPSAMPIFRSTGQARLLARLFISGDEVPLADLARELDIPLPTLHGEASRLERAGLLRSRRIGRSRLMCANTAHPAAKPLAELLRVTFTPGAIAPESGDVSPADTPAGMGEDVCVPHTPPVAQTDDHATAAVSADSLRLRSLLRSKYTDLDHALRDASAAEAYLFGSVARGTAGPDSDIDILVAYRPEVSDVDAYLNTGALIDTLSEILGTPVDVLTQVVAKPQVLESARKDAIPLGQIN